MIARRNQAVTIANPFLIPGIWWKGDIGAPFRPVPADSRRPPVAQAGPRQRLWTAARGRRSTRGRASVELSMFTRGTFPPPDRPG